MNNNDFEKLKYDDIWNIILYAIYKMTADPKYSTISELIYTLDKENFNNFCSTFGGLTIKVPTQQEKELMINALTAYQLINFEHKTFNEVYLELELSRFQKNEFIKAYNTITDILKNYE